MDFIMTTFLKKIDGEIDIFSDGSIILRNPVSKHEIDIACREIINSMLFYETNHNFSLNDMYYLTGKHKLSKHLIKYLGIEFDWAGDDFEELYDKLSKFGVVVTSKTGVSIDYLMKFFHFISYILGDFDDPNFFRVLPISVVTFPDAYIEWNPSLYRYYARFLTCNDENDFIKVKQNIENSFSDFMKVTILYRNLFYDKSQSVKYLIERLYVLNTSGDFNYNIIEIMGLIELLLISTSKDKKSFVESISYQLRTKLVNLLYIRDNTVDLNGHNCLLYLIYDYRSRIAHGSFIFKDYMKSFNHYKSSLKINEEFSNQDELENFLTVRATYYLSVVISMYINNKDYIKFIKKGTTCKFK